MNLNITADGIDINIDLNRADDEAEEKPRRFPVGFSLPPKEEK